ncbi:hypothetical protein CSV75_12490 [Sporosarcina sp. P18a]|uniref:hypothetical protein n=1 Tax=Sporosarcina sp. P18a TaxID=2048259 RepID=UPI000C164609|nr:hypothetical protein [Sporosarcina sp. P18a]PIC79404.1 hypothetical protein CSV75_12490 [Sporosarcina sp. P18a]
MLSESLRETLELQKLAGIAGRNAGHKFEETITKMINSIDINVVMDLPTINQNVVIGNPAINLMKYIIQKENITDIISFKAWWVGGLATSGAGDVLYDESENIITKCKSDVVIKFETSTGIISRGISVKTCNSKKPGNAQLYFTTASSFSRILRENEISVSEQAEVGLKMFCGDNGFRPIDLLENLDSRLSDPTRFFWEEIPKESLEDLENLFHQYQDEITRILLQKAYLNDPYPPNFVLHQTCKYDDINNCEIALFTMDELINYSRDFKGFHIKPYKIRKGSFKNDPHSHDAPRFGFVQFQRAGNKQHPTQLQFNLQAGYFRKCN